MAMEADCTESAYYSDSRHRFRFYMHRAQEEHDRCSQWL